MASSLRIYLEFPAAKTLMKFRLLLPPTEYVFWEFALRNWNISNVWVNLKNIYGRLYGFLRVLILFLQNIATL